MDYKNKIKSYSLFILFILISSCGKNDDTRNTDCDPIAEGNKKDLIIISPLQTIYNQGDVINVKVTIPVQNDYFGTTPINIYTLSGASFGSLIITMYPTNDIFLGNTVTLISGTLTDVQGKFNFPLNLNTGNYEFEANIKLNRLGNYKFPSNGPDFIAFVGNNFCKRLVLDTSKAGGNVDGNIEFVVQ
ncbi:hypothetical protein [Flavobacterium sp.]|uniref:hypothetical protein n=1 Tax=Flavobacterium sp. TaxID=239 RepID=UPI00286D95DF|nr:hypothetical protein [Flavobacterium sp.]